MKVKEGNGTKKSVDPRPWENEDAIVDRKLDSAVSEEKAEIANITEMVAKEYVSDKDIESYRNELGNPLKDGVPRETVAIGRTNIAGLEDCVFKGASIKVREAAGLPDLDEVYPNRAIVAPYDYKADYHLEQYVKHAEENVMAEFEAALEKAGIAPEEAKGDLYIRQSFSIGVCNKCTVGLFKPSKGGRKGIFKQFTEKYPHVNLYVSTYKGGGTGDGQGTLSFNIVNGKITDVVKYANGRRY